MSTATLRRNSTIRARSDGVRIQPLSKSTVSKVFATYRCGFVRSADTVSVTNIWTRTVVHTANDEQEEFKMAADNNGNSGWVKISRKILDHKYWLSEPFTRGQAWVDLILTAQWKDDENANAGTVQTTMSALAKRWKWDYFKVMRFLKEMEKNNSIRVQTVNGLCTSILIENWVKYQGVRKGDDPECKGECKGKRKGFTRENWQKNSYGAKVTSKVNAKSKNIVYYNDIVYPNELEKEEEKKKDQPHDAHADAASAEWKTDDPRVPIEYRPDFDSYEQYMRWRNQ